MEKRLKTFIWEKADGQTRINAISRSTRRIAERYIPELHVVADSERLVPKDFQYGSKEIEAEVLNALKPPRYPGYPKKGLKMTQAEYKAWVAAGKPLRTYVGVPGNRPGFYSDHDHRYREVDGKRVLKAHVEDLHELGLDEHQQIPYHQNIEAMVTQSEDGVPTGAGWYRHLGPNKTADPVVFRPYKGKVQVLLIKRADSAEWALAGGHIEPEEEARSHNTRKVAIKVAKRELREETGLRFLRFARSQIILENIPVASKRATANAWPETTVVLLKPLRWLPAWSRLKADPEETLDVKWMPIEEALGGALKGSHASYVKLSLLAWERQTGLVVRNDGRYGKAARHP